MATDLSEQPVQVQRERDVPPLESGDHLDQATFHERYEAMPPGTRAELIGGVVFMPSPAKLPHGRFSSRVLYWLGVYEEATPGVESLYNTTVILADDSEPQPDAALRILSMHGGQSHEDDDEYLVGAPELVVEIASSSASYDLHSKLRDYEQHGVKEYIVILTRKRDVRWFHRVNDQFVEQDPESDGYYHSKEFGGLWLDPEALFEADLSTLRAVVQTGMKSPEHAATVQALEARKS